MRSMLKLVRWRGSALKHIRAETMTLSQQRTNFSTLGSPMFPQRAEPDIDSIFDKADKSKDKNAKATPDFLSDHGGKVALVALGIAIALFYSYYKGGKNKNKVEEEILNVSNIEPYELQELRYLNNLSTEEYTKVVEQCKEHFSDGFTTYKNFIRFITTKSVLKNRKLQQTHMLDTFVQSYITQTFKLKHHCLDTETRLALYFQPGFAERLADHSAEINYQEVPIAVDFLLASLNMLMLEDAHKRVEGLYHLAELSGNDGSTGGSELSGFSNETLGSESQQHQDGEPELDYSTISASSAEGILKLLIETDQIPAEKQVAESGVKWPFKEYLRKDAKQMIESHRAAIKKKDSNAVLKPIDAPLSLLELQTLLLSGQVCAWAECYRRKN